MQKVITHVGLDVHAERIVIATLEGQSREPVVRDIPNDVKAIRRTFQRLAKDAYELRCCYEAGPCGFELHRQLTKMGIACEVIAPGLIPVRASDRVKTDRRDATKLARLFRAGELTSITVPTADQEAVRDLVRLADNIRKDLTAARSRLQHFLLRHGRSYRSGRGWTQKYWVWLRAQQFEREFERLTFENYVREVEHQQARRDEIHAELERVAASEPYAPSVAKLAALRGISPIGGVALIAEIGDFRRFESPRELMSFVGLVPREHSSGGSVRKGGITKTGNSLVRRVLVEAAWHHRHRPRFGPDARRHLLRGQAPEVVEYVTKAQTRLCRRYARLVSRGKKSQVAVVAVARELCGFLWGLMAVGV
jgi:transposase